MKEQYQNLVCIHSLRSDGNMSSKYGEEADQNRKNFIQKMGFQVDQFLLMQANNQDKIVELKDSIIEEFLYYKLVEADAIICRVPNVFLYLNFADCIPLTIYDKKQNIFAFAHLGWRSTYLNLHQKLLSVFEKTYHSMMEDLVIVIGPSIKKESYVLEDPDQKEDEAWKPYVHYVKDHLYQVDLLGYVKDFFLKKGIKNIMVSHVDTASSPEYFSHYQSIHNHEVEGRFFYASGMVES